MYVKTKRLELKPIGSADLAALTELLTDESVGEFYMVPDFADRAQAEALSQRLMALSEDADRYIAGIFREDQLIGLLNETEVSGDCMEVGYAVLPRHQGQGYATEALAGAIDYFFTQGFRQVVAGAFEENAASMQVMRKSGMTRLDRQDTVTYRGKDHRCVYYGVRKPATGKSNYDLQVDIAKKIFLEYDQEAMIRKFGLAADEMWIYLEYLHTPCRISRTHGGIQEQRKGQWQECRSFSTVMTIYDLLCYCKGENAPALFGQWCAVGNFVVTGVTETENFTKKFAARFDGRLEALKAACEGLGGVLQPRMAGADVTCRFAVTPFFPVLLQFWAGDEEFAPKLMLLWDRNSDSFLHFETTFYLQGDLLERLWQRMEERK